MCTSIGQRAANGTNTVKCSPAMSTRSDLASNSRMSPISAGTVVRDRGEQVLRARRDVRVAVDLAVRVVQRDADLRAPVLEHVDLPHAGHRGQRGGPVGPRLDDGPGAGHAEVRPRPGVLRAEAHHLAPSVAGQRPAEPDAVQVAVLAVLAGLVRARSGQAGPERRRLVLEHRHVVVAGDLGQVARRRRGQRVELRGRQERPVLPGRRDRDPLAGQRVLPQRRAARASARAAWRRPAAPAAATCPRRRSRSAPGRRSAW